MNFKKWIWTLLEEKGLECETFCIEEDGFFHLIEMEFLVDFMSGLPKEMRDHIKTTLVKIDFMNGNCLDFLEHCAKGYVKAYAAMEL